MTNFSLQCPRASEVLLGSLLTDRSSVLKMVILLDSSRKQNTLSFLDAYSSSRVWVKKYSSLLYWSGLCFSQVYFRLAYYLAVLLFVELNISFVQKLPICVPNSRRRAGGPWREICQMPSRAQHRSISHCQSSCFQWVGQNAGVKRESGTADYLDMLVAVV